MRIPESCAKCLYDKQVHKVHDEEYLYRVREIIKNRKDTDTSPYLVYLFNRLYEEMFGRPNGYSDIKRKYNDLLPKEARKYLDHTDVILAKGQGNYESLSGNDRHIFYSFLCKCDLFINRFQVPKLTGIFIEE